MNMMLPPHVAIRCQYPIGISLVVEWLRLLASIAGSMCLIPSWGCRGAKVPVSCTVWPKKKKKEEYPVSGWREALQFSFLAIYLFKIAQLKRKFRSKQCPMSACTKNNALLSPFQFLHLKAINQWGSVDTCEYRSLSHGPPVNALP